MLQTFLLASALFAGQSQALPRLTHADLEKAQGAISEFRMRLRAEQTNGVVASREENYAKVAAFAKEALAGVDVKRIPATDAAEWAALFTEARMPESAIELEKRSLDNYTVQAMFAEVDLLNNLLDGGRKQEAYDVVRHTMNWQGSQVGMIGEGLLNAAKRNHLDKTDPTWLFRCLNTLASRLETGNEAAKTHGNEMADFAYVDLKMKALEVRYAANSKDPSVLDQIKALRKQFASSNSKNAFGQSPVYRVDEFFNQVNAIGQPAPAVTCQKSIGDFSSLQNLKGKVVLLDFMAHWCGPCKAELPKIRELAEKYGASGLQVVSVTSYYGYFGAEQGISKEKEFEKMHGFVKDFAISWPVVFDPQQLTQSSYHVGSIPHVVVIDRKGMIRKVAIGNTPENEAEIASLVKQLVSETR